MITIEKSKLLAALQCAAIEDIRFYLNGVLLECCANGDVHIVSTDSHIVFAGLIAAPSVQWTDKQNGPWSIIIPRDAIKVACKGNGTVHLAAMPDGRYLIGDTAFAAIDGTYPDWRRFIPQNEHIDKPKPTPWQINPHLLVRGADALGLWHGWRKGKNGYLAMVHHCDTGCGVCMLGNDMTAIVGICPMRESNLPAHVLPFTVSSYGV